MTGNWSSAENEDLTENASNEYGGENYGHSERGSVSTSETTRAETPTRSVTEQTDLEDQGSATGNSRNSSSSSDQPRNFRLLSDIYNETQKIKLEEELLLCVVDEPESYEQAAHDESWVQAMESEIEAIEKNNTWKLEELPPRQKPIA